VRIEVHRCLSKPLLLCVALGAIAFATAAVQIASPARTRVAAAAPAGREMMQLLRDEHETMRLFLAEQDAKQRAIAAIESEPEPDPSIVFADAEPETAVARTAAAKRPAGKPVRLAKAPAAPPLPIPSPPMALAHMPPPPPPPALEPPSARGWVHDAYRLPRRLWAAVGELMDERPPIPPRPIPPV